MAPQAAYEALQHNLDGLLSSLQSHPNLAHDEKNQPLPGEAGQNKVYFMWDFVNRSRSMLDDIDPSLPTNQKEQWSEVVQRCAFTNVLINDTSGKLSVMTQEIPGKEVDFGDDIKQQARNLIPETALVGTVTGTA